MDYSNSAEIPSLSQLTIFDRAAKALLGHLSAVKLILQRGASIPPRDKRDHIPRELEAWLSATPELLESLNGELDQACTYIHATRGDYELRWRKNGSALAVARDMLADVIAFLSPGHELRHRDSQEFCDNSTEFTLPPQDLSQLEVDVNAELLALKTHRLRAIESKEAPSVPPAAGQGVDGSPAPKRIKNINARMLQVLATNEEARVWSASKWAEQLGYGKTTVIESATWEKLKKFRELSRRDQAEGMDRSQTAPRGRRTKRAD